MGKIGILVPVYNAEATLPECLESLAAQTLGDFTAAMVDDGSTDATPDILRDFAARDPRFRVVFRPHEGLISALNAGLAALDTPLVARLDADDVAHPERLERQWRWMEAHPETDLLGCRYEILGSRPPGAGSVAYREWQNALLSDADIRRNLYIESPFAHPTVMFRRTAVTALGGYRDAGFPEDYDLWLRMARAGCRFARLADTLVGWRDRPDRLTWTDPRYSIESFARCKAHHLARGPLNGRGPVMILGAGIAGGRIGRALLTEGVEVAMFLDVDPRKIGGTKRGRPVLAFDDGLRQHAGQMLLVAVGARGRRAEVQAELNARGFVEGRDYLCVA